MPPSATVVTGVNAGRAEPAYPVSHEGGGHAGTV